MIEANIDGFEEIETLLLAISNKYEKPQQAIKHLKKPVRNALKVAQKKLKSKVGSKSSSGVVTGGGHEVTGKLKRTIKITVRSANRKYRRRYPNAVIMAQVGFIWKKSQVPDDFYKRVLALEYGTRYQEPRRYVARTMLQERRGIMNSVITEAKKEILGFAKTQSQVNDAKSRR